MAEYIDRNTAIAKVTALEVIEPLSTMVDVRRLLADMPAADVTQVVRRKDCKNFEPSFKNDAYSTCCCLRGMIDPDAYDFCSYGERKDGE